MVNGSVQIFFVSDNLAKRLNVTLTMNLLVSSSLYCSLLKDF